MTVEIHVGDALIAAVMLAGVAEAVGHDEESHWRVYPRCQSPDIRYWTTRPDPTSVHAKPLRSRQFSAFRTERQNLVRSVHSQSHRAGGSYV